MTLRSSCFIILFFFSFSTGAVIEQRNFLTREACLKNPKLVFCSESASPSPQSADNSPSSTTVKEAPSDTDDAPRKADAVIDNGAATAHNTRNGKRHLDLVVPPPLPQGVKTKAMLADKDNADEFVSRDVKPTATNEEKQEALMKFEQLRQKCVKFGPLVKENCKEKDTPKEHVGRCAAYFRDCSRFMAKSNPLYDVAHSFSSGVNVNLATVEVNGIPYYPINEEGGVGVSHTLGIPFGSWGGGFSQGVGVRDYWSSNQEVGANWYDGKYGYKNGWSVPLVQSLGVEGGQHNVVSVPLHGKDFGRIGVDNGYHVGGYYGHNDHVGVDWKKGNVAHTFGVGAPIAGAGFMTGQAVAFPATLGVLLMNGNPPSTLIVGDVTVPSNQQGWDQAQAEIGSPTSLEYQQEEDEDEFSSDDDDIQYCDCIVAALQQSLPGTPGKRGVIPYTSVYDTQQQARKRGYWIPGVPVNAKIVNAEKNTESGIHFINTFLYTIELEHGKFRWTVVRNYKDFTLLNNRLLAHRAAERIRAPVRRFRRNGKVREAQEKVDAILEHVHSDTTVTHKEECPYSKTTSTKKKTKMEILKPTVEAFETAAKRGKEAPLATAESPLETPNDERRASMIEAVNSGILQEEPETKPSNSEMQVIKEESVITHTEDQEQYFAKDSEQEQHLLNASAKKMKARRRKKHTLPPFPRLPDYMVTNVTLRMEQLENWLQMILHIPINRNHHETAEFLEISRFSFVNDLGEKHTEGFVKKRPGGSRVFLGWKQCCVRYFVPWSRRWLMVRDSFVAYMDPSSEQIRLVLLMDRDFKVAAGGREADGIPTGLIITNTQHELHLKCGRLQDTNRYKRVIEQSTAGPGNVWIQPHRYASSFPIRTNSYAKWFVDARSFMAHAADMMELAREEIFICDWWLSPEIYMKRPDLTGAYWRLDHILKRKANQGVKIFILLYKEMEMALGLNSMYTKRTLQGLHPNIKVMRHPDHYPSTGTFFWAHHEKLIVIDQLISFVGGVDLCFGRWDDDQHLLTDMGSVQFDQNHEINKEFSFAKGLQALAIAPLKLSPLGLEEDEEVIPSDETHPRFPAHTIPRVCPTDASGSCHPKVTNIIITNDEDVVDSVNLGNDADEIVYTDKETGGVMVKILKKISKPNKAAVVKYKTSTSVLSAGDRSSQVSVNSDKKDDGKEKKPARVKHTSSSDKKIPIEVLDQAGPATSFLDKAAKSGMDLATAAERYKAYVNSGAIQKEKHRSQTPPMKRKESRITRAVDNWKSQRAKRKWKDVLDADDPNGYEIDFLRLMKKEDQSDDCVDGAAKLWVGKDYVNFVHKDFIEVDMPFHDFIDRGTTPRMPWHDIHSVTFGVPARDVARHFIQRWNATKTEKLKNDANYPYLLPKTYESLKLPRVFRNPKFAENVNVQVLRSLSKWSGLINQTEESIQMAYLSLIANAKHYIYIENQFFVSMIDSPEVSNEICKVIYERIVRAHKEKQNFRVYIMIPLLPGFEGDVGAPKGSSLQAVLHWTYQSLSRGPNSLIERLKLVVPDPHKYLSIGSLRTYDLLNGKLVTELIYIHCKLLIVDDEHVIIGSANINDRSQVGNRDSEVCCLYSDINFEQSMMDGKPYKAGRFARSLRLQCMKEHLGLLSNSRRKAKFPYEVTCDDPVADSFFVDVWQDTARSNTTIYEEVFRAFPTDYVETLEEYEKWTRQMPLAKYSPQQAEERMRDVRGTLVEFPLKFFVRHVLTPGITSKEGLVPSAVFT
ncbi:unnamed protein product [Auanema sp. JU1783]|nr:unnamed protein product [Auanema sp. JU1783]